MKYRAKLSSPSQSCAQKSVPHRQTDKVGRLLYKSFFFQDEYGNILGGKKASIQFAYNLRRQLDGGPDPNVDIADAQKEVEKFYWG